jgi:hypothetical protein
MELGNGGDLFIPNSVKFIGHYAFLNCYNFAGTLTIPSSVITIADEGFRGLIALSQIVLEGFDSQPN